jgi:large subunit ribosomal protein L9
MKVILQSNVPNLGELGDVVEVKDGYGRNYLIPRGLALLADERNVRRLEHQKRLIAHKKSKLIARSKEMAGRLAETPISIKRQAGEEGKLFGAVTNRDIADALAAEGIVVDRRDVELDDAIKNIGVFQVPVKLYGGVEAQVKVYVLRE